VLLIAAFAIYVIVKKRVRITRSTTITGDNARTFGILLLILAIPFSSAIGALLKVLLPPSARAWPVPQTLFGILFGAIVLVMAYFFRDHPAEGLPASPISGDLPSSVVSPVVEDASESNSTGETVL
jgi:VIT1/CCC1 family predicted Fe2+/Mn2+ transporter